MANDIGDPIGQVPVDCGKHARWEETGTQSLQCGGVAKTNLTLPLKNCLVLHVLIASGDVVDSVFPVQSVKGVLPRLFEVHCGGPIGSQTRDGDKIKLRLCNFAQSTAGVTRPLFALQQISVMWPPGASKRTYLAGVVESEPFVGVIHKTISAEVCNRNDQSVDWELLVTRWLRG